MRLSKPSTLVAVFFAVMALAAATEDGSSDGGPNTVDPSPKFPVLVPGTKFVRECPYAEGDNNAARPCGKGDCVSYLDNALDQRCDCPEGTCGNDCSIDLHSEGSVLRGLGDMSGDMNGGCCPNDCGNNGNCTSVAIATQCVCNEGWGGVDCTKPIKDVRVQKIDKSIYEKFLKSKDNDKSLQNVPIGASEDGAPGGGASGAAAAFEDKPKISGSKAAHHHEKDDPSSMKAAIDHLLALRANPA